MVNEKIDNIDPRIVPKAKPAKITKGVPKPIKKTQIIEKKKYTELMRNKFWSLNSKI